MKLKNIIKAMEILKDEAQFSAESSVLRETLIKLNAIQATRDMEIVDCFQLTHDELALLRKDIKTKKTSYLSHVEEEHFCENKMEVMKAFHNRLKNYPSYITENIGLKEVLDHVNEVEKKILAENKI